MRGLHLKKRGNHWYYQRRRPERYRDVEPQCLISFSLRTSDFSEAKRLASEHSIQLDRRWQQALAQGVSLASGCAVERYQAAQDVSRRFGLSPEPCERLNDGDLLDRLRLLIEGSVSQAEGKAVLGVIERPALTVMQGFERFWAHIEDERTPLSRDQQRVKRNAYLKSIENFGEAAGAIALYDITREQALTFRSWWMARIAAEGYAAHTANRQFSALRRLIRTNADMDSVTTENPFARIRIKDSGASTRSPFATSFIQNELLGRGRLDPLPDALQHLVGLLVNTGMRPSEAIGLELADFDLETATPFVHIRRNGTRSLKTDHSERQIPLVGVSLKAAEAIVSQGGWGKWAGKNMYATTVINRHFRESGLVPDKKQSLYSLRHWFQDQLTKRDVVDRAQAQLMGHKFQRPKYGYGKDLAELHEIIAAFAIE